MTVIYSPAWRESQDRKNKEAEKEIRKLIGADFRAARAETGLTQTKLAAALEMPFTTIRHWEEGRRIPPSYIKKWYLQEVKKLVKKKAARK